MPNKLSLLAERTVPRFVKEEYPQFLKFIKGYLEYLEREGGEYDCIASLLDIMDIDKTSDDFIQQFRNEYLAEFPENMVVDARFIIKKIKDFYASKGTEKSFEFLFRTIFDVPVTFYYPKVDMLRVSDGAWIQPYYVIPKRIGTTGNNPDLFALVDQKIRGESSGAIAYISERKLLSISFPELIPNHEFNISENVWTDYGNVISTNNINDETLKLVKSGSGLSGISGEFSVASSSMVDIAIDIKEFQNQDVSAKIELILDDVKIGETNTTGNFSVSSNAVTPNTNSTIKLQMTGDDDWAVSINSISMKNSADVLFVYGSSLSEVIGEFIGGEVISVISERYDENGVKLPDIPNFMLTDKIREQSAIIRPKGRYDDTGGHISSTKKIQDSYYYQDFSYELISEIPLKFYDEVVKNLVHPSGFKMFGKVEKKSIDVISLRDLIHYFTILISWTEIKDLPTTTATDSSKYKVSKDTDDSQSGRNDWEHFIVNKEEIQYDNFAIGQLDNFSADDMNDLRSKNFQMVFVDGIKITSDNYEIVDRKITFKNAPSESTITRDAAKMNIEIIHLSQSLQEPNIFNCDGRNVRYKLSSDLTINNVHEVLVFVDGKFVTYEDDYTISRYVDNGVNSTDIIFNTVYNLNVVIDVIVLDGNAIPGRAYEPYKIYSDLPEGSIAYNKPFKIQHMTDSSNEENLMIFVNGKKANSQTMYAMYYDLDEKQYMFRPTFTPEQMKVTAPFDISVVYLKSYIVGVDVLKADNVTKEFYMKENFNTFEYYMDSEKEEHTFVDVISADNRKYTFNRTHDTDIDSWEILRLELNELENNDKIKLYFEIEIDKLNQFFKKYDVGVNDNGLIIASPFSRIMTFTKSGKYIYNNEFTVNDNTKPLEILIGHLSCIIDHITLSIVDAI